MILQVTCSRDPLWMLRHLVYLKRHSLLTRRELGELIAQRYARERLERWSLVWCNNDESLGVLKERVDQGVELVSWAEVHSEATDDRAVRSRALLVERTSDDIGERVTEARAPCLPLICEMGIRINADHLMSA